MTLLVLLLFLMTNVCYDKKVHQTFTTIVGDGEELSERGGNMCVWIIANSVTRDNV